MEGIFLRKCKFAKSLLMQAIGGQGWIEIQNWILSIVLDTEVSSATHLSENPQVRLDTREIPTGDTERHTDNCDTTSDTNRPTQSNNAVFTSQRHNNSAPSLSRTMTSFQVKDKIDHNKFHNCGSSNTYVYTSPCRSKIQRREQTSSRGFLLNNPKCITFGGYQREKNHLDLCIFISTMSLFYLALCNFKCTMVQFQDPPPRFGFLSSIPCDQIPSYP